MKYSDQWNLESIFPGGSSSVAFAEALSTLQTQLSELQNAPLSLEYIDRIQTADLAFRQADAFVLCLQSQNSFDEYALHLRTQLTTLEAQLNQLNNRWDHWLKEMSNEAFNRLTQENPLRFLLEERRKRASYQLPLVQEDLISQLSVDGYHGWGELYPSLVAELKIECQIDGKSLQLSVGQAENQLSHSNPEVRKSVFSAFESAWKNRGGIFAQTLNHIAGYRLSIYRQRGWEDPLFEPLFENRMKSATLDAMWSVVKDNRAPFLQFLQFKAEKLGMEKLAWYDIDAPFFSSKEDEIPYDEAAALIIAQFAECHPPMGAFAQKALSNRWVEAEDRPGKRPGGFCVSFPKSCESRIFMTYSGTMTNVATLAHELGHAYHNAMVDSAPGLAQHYRMNIAETASTFAEQVVSDSLLDRASTQEEKKGLLADRIQRSTIYFLNIYARFLFERQFYDERKKGFLGVGDLCRLMQEAQEEAFEGSLSVYHPYFWASKLHFYFTGVPFYNFPYTFGYLFSLGIYAIAKKKGAAWMGHYDALLTESGMMSIEELARKHLGVDLTQREFWQGAIDIAKADVEQFFKISD